MTDLIELARFASTSAAPLAVVGLIAFGYAFRDQIRYQREQDAKRLELDLKRAEQAALHQAAITTLQGAIDRLADRLTR